MSYYYGGKGGHGVYHTIINQVPPHETYIELFFGGGGILKNKKTASRNIGVDLDPGVIRNWQQYKDIELSNTDALSFLKEFKFRGNEFIYADPPYLTRACKRNKYNFELTEQEHEELLILLKQLPCKVMISGYSSKLYKRQLESFRTIQFNAMTRGGYPKTELLWMNYPEPAELHDYQYLGSDFREREKITRKRKRWIRNLKQMPRLERLAILTTIQETDFEKC